MRAKEGMLKATTATTKQLKITTTGKENFPKLLKKKIG